MKKQHFEIHKIEILKTKHALSLSVWRRRAGQTL